MWQKAVISFGNGAYSSDAEPDALPTGRAAGFQPMSDPHSTRRPDRVRENHWMFRFGFVEMELSRDSPESRAAAMRL